MGLYCVVEVAFSGLGTATVIFSQSRALDIIYHEFILWTNIYYCLCDNNLYYNSGTSLMAVPPPGARINFNFIFEFTTESEILKDSGLVL